MNVPCLPVVHQEEDGAEAVEQQKEVGQVLHVEEVEVGEEEGVQHGAGQRLEQGQEDAQFAEPLVEE